MYRRVIIHIFSPMLIGGLIYILFRSYDLVMFDWFRFLGISRHIETARELTLTLNIPSIIKYSLPDAIWLYSFTYSMLLIWNKKPGYLKYVLIPMATILSLGSELLQLLKLMQGTFDIWDLILCIAATVLVFVTFYQFQRSDKKLQLKL